MTVKTFRGEKLRFHGKLDTFSAVPRDLARDKRLTDRAGRIALYLWSQSGEWRVSTRSIMAALGKGQGSVVAAIDELAGLGWLIKQPVYVKAGAKKPSGWVYHLARRNAPFTDDEVRRFSRPIIRGEGVSESDTPDDGMDDESVSESDTESVSESDTETAESVSESDDNRRAISRRASSRAGDHAGAGEADAGAGDHAGAGDDAGTEQPGSGTVDDWAAEVADQEDTGQARARAAAREPIDLTRDEIPAAEVIGRDSELVKTHSYRGSSNTWIRNRPREPEPMPDWWLAARLTADDWQRATDARLSAARLTADRQRSKTNAAAFIRRIIDDESAKLDAIKAKPRFAWDN